MAGASVRPEIFFFVGKGGVGKSTVSALAALFFAAAGRNTLLVSMDPAHNQRDLFETEFSEKPKTIQKALAVREIDSQYWIDRYLKQTHRQICKTYLYESAFCLQDHFKVLKFSPGLEEYALLTAFEDTLQHVSNEDVLIFDMAPTAMAMRFFSLPGNTDIWLRELLKIRNLILKKKEIVANIRNGRCDMGRDRVKDKIEVLIDRHSRLRDSFLSNATAVNLVMNTDPLSLSEAVRIQRGLTDIGICIDRVVVNKARPEDDVSPISKIFIAQKLTVLPFAGAPLVGLSAMQNYLRENIPSFDSFNKQFR